MRVVLFTCSRCVHPTAVYKAKRANERLLRNPSRSDLNRIGVRVRMSEFSPPRIGIWLGNKRRSSVLRISVRRNTDLASCRARSCTGPCRPPPCRISRVAPSPAAIETKIERSTLVFCALRARLRALYTQQGIYTPRHRVRER